MRIYSNSFELMSEMGRELNSYGQTVKPKTYQNKVIEGNEDFITKELICQQYCLTSLGDPVWLFIFSHSKEWADAEFKERIGWYDLNPGKAWELRKDLWEQFLVNGKFDYTYPERIWNSLDIYGSTSFNCDSAMQSVIELLKRDNDTRKAVLPIFHGTDLRFLDGSNVYLAQCIMISLSVRMVKERRYYIFAIIKEVRTLYNISVMMYILHGDSCNM